MELCNLCKGINVNSLVPHCLPEEDSNGEIVQVCYQHHATFNNLKSSARQCPMCQLMYLALWERNKDHQPHHDGHHDDDDVSDDFLSGDQSAIWLISGGNMFFDLSLPKRLSQVRINVGSYGRLQSVDIALYAHPDDPLSVCGDVIGRPPASHSSSIEVSNLMRSWLSDCLAHHTACETPSTVSLGGQSYKAFLPKRLLQLGHGRKPQLIETKDQEYKYAALSYCWGTSHPVITTTENYGRVTEGFGKTLQDAISICLLMDLEYLWIDALCIIQDDERDWQNEAAKMGKIYKNATVTISATGARDTSVGCLRPRPKPLTEPVALHSQCSKSKKVGKMMACSKPGSIEEVLDRSPLNSRGWCLQERVLSPRIIHFAEDQLYWECETLSQAEDGTTLDMTSKFKRELSNANSERETLRAWHNLVQDYTSRSLSRASDMFPALAGLADAVRQRLSDQTYYAGIWSQDLPLSLLWSSPVAALTTRMREFRAPSWSWASTSGPVTFAYRASALTLSDVEEQVEILGVHVAVRTPTNPLGEVQGGTLTIRGRIKNVKAPKTGRDYQQRPWKSTDGQLPVLNDSGEEIGDLDFDDHSPESYPTLVRCVMVSKRSSAIKGYMTNRVYFLALAPTGDDEKGTFCRIGVGYLTQKDYFDDSLAETIVIV